MFSESFRDISETSGNYAKLTTAQLAQKVYYANDIHHLKELGVNVGGYVKTSGYWNIHDKGGADYTIVDDSTLVDDGGSVITLNNGLKAVLLNDGVDCAMFGASKSNELSETEVNNIFDNWTKYVNKTKSKYFSVKEQTYHIYKPLYIRKSFIGVGQPVFYYRTEGLGKTVSTETTFDGRFNFNVKAVMGVNPSRSTDTEDRFTLKNFTLSCTTNDDDTSPSQDIGLYFPQGNSFKMDNIVVARANQSGFVFKENWMGEMRRLNSWKSRGSGFEMIGTFTSLTMSNCYAHGFQTRGFDANGVFYSTFENLGADSGVGIPYSFASCNGVNLNSLGSELVECSQILYLGDFKGSINGLYVERATVSKSIIDVHTGSEFSINGIEVRTSKPKDGTQPKSFNVQNFGINDKFNIDINYKTTTIDLSGYIARELVNIAKGRVSFNTIDDAKVYQNNKLGNRNELIEKRVIPGGEANYYSDGFVKIRQSVSLGGVDMTKLTGVLYVSPLLTITNPVTVTEIFSTNIKVRNVSGRYILPMYSTHSSTNLTFYLASVASMNVEVSVIIIIEAKWK